MQNYQSISLLTARLNRLKRSKKANRAICRKILRKIAHLKKEEKHGKKACQSLGQSQER